MCVLRKGPRPFRLVKPDQITSYAILAHPPTTTTTNTDKGTNSSITKFPAQMQLGHWPGRRNYNLSFVCLSSHAPDTVRRKYRSHKRKRARTQVEDNWLKELEFPLSVVLLHPVWRLNNYTKHRQNQPITGTKCAFNT